MKRLFWFFLAIGFVTGIAAMGINSIDREASAQPAQKPLKAPAKLDPVKPAVVEKSFEGRIVKVWTEGTKDFIKIKFQNQEKIIVIDRETKTTIDGVSKDISSLSVGMGAVIKYKEVDNKMVALSINAQTLKEAAKPPALPAPKPAPPAKPLPPTAPTPPTAPAEKRPPAPAPAPAPPAPAPGPAPAPPPPAETKGREELNLIWNVWAEDGSKVQYKPLTKLAPELAKTDPGYSLYVHLSNCSYEIDKRGFFIHKAREKLIRIIEEYLSTTKPLMLKAILIPDSDFFEPLAKPVEDLEIDLDKVREQLKSGSQLEGDPVDKLIKEKPLLPFFVFGSARFTGIKTRGKEGTGHIGIAIWHDGKPVDDFSVPFCISSSECVGHTPQYSTREKESLPINFSSSPDAALHFFGLGSGKDNVVGVFWNNKKPGRFTIWDTGRSQEGFYDQLEKDIVPKLNKSKTPGDWMSSGSALFNLLFPDKTHGGVDSGSEFKEYFKEYLRKPQIGSDKEPPFFEPFENDKPPLLFVRFTELKADLPFIIPIGLVAVDVGDGKKEFIGFHQKIEAPLANDTATLKPECIKRWVVSLPTEDKEAKLKTAYENIDPSFVTTWKTYASKEFFDRIRQPEQESGINSFGVWIEKDERDKEPAAIITMSHHEKGALSDSSGEVLALNVKREFSQPSIAILDGCGTGEPGATEFIKELNDRGVMTVIATSTSVESEMAGHFVSCFGQEIEAARKRGQKEIAVSDAFTGTLKCLHKKPNKYDMKVLKYSLLGDGNLRLCIPGVP